MKLLLRRVLITTGFLLALFFILVLIIRLISDTSIRIMAVPAVAFIIGISTLIGIPSTNTGLRTISRSELLARIIALRVSSTAFLGMFTFVTLTFSRFNLALTGGILTVIALVVVVIKTQKYIRYYLAFPAQHPSKNSWIVVYGLIIVVISVIVTAIFQYTYPYILHIQ